MGYMAHFGFPSDGGELLTVQHTFSLLCLGLPFIHPLIFWIYSVHICWIRLLYLCVVFVFPSPLSPSPLLFPSTERWTSCVPEDISLPHFFREMFDNVSGMSGPSMAVVLPFFFSYG